MMAPERAGPEGAPAPRAGAGLRGAGGAGAAAPAAPDLSAPAAPAPASPPVSPLFNAAAATTTTTATAPLPLIKEGDAAGGEAAVGAAEAGGGAQPRSPGAAADDDDLTSLTWLQDRNLLRGMKLSPPMGESQESPTSDFGDEGSSNSSHSHHTSEEGDAASSVSSSASPAPAAPAIQAASLPPLAPSGPTSRYKHPLNVPYDPQVHVNSKPPYSFSSLIFMAIEDSPQRALPVKEIYSWILEHFPYFKNAPTGWKNSVRHNLSLNKCFRKVEKAPNLGKGSLWMVDTIFRPNLLQALQKAPFHPHSTAERIAAIASTPLSNGCSSSSSSSSSGVSSGSDRPSVPPSSAGDAAPPVAATPTGRHPGRRLPDPQLFPFLSRRLAASGVDVLPVAADAGAGAGAEAVEGAAPADVEAKADAGAEVDDVAVGEDTNSLDDVDAAAAMLALKHGPLMLITRNDIFRHQSQNVDPKSKKKMRASKIVNVSDGAHPVITTSPSEDHTYSAGPTVPLQTPSSSPDEAYEGSASEDSYHQPTKLYIADWPITGQCTTRAPIVGATDPEEQRKIAEGADALLNLAGITTRKRSHSGEFALSIASLPEETNPPSPPAPKRTIATRGRKRGVSSAVNSSTNPARSRLLWPAAARVGKRRGTGELRRGTSNRRRGTLHHNNNHIHLKTAKASLTSFHRSERPIRTEDKTSRPRR